MKRYLSVLIAVLMVAGLATAAGAALTFNADFWTDGNPVNNYAKEGAGAPDLGGTFILQPGEQINVDIYFSTDLNLVAASWDLQYSPASLASVIGYTAPAAPWVLPTFVDSSGSLTFEAAVFPGSTVTGDNNFFGSVLFECTGIGDVDLVLADYLGFLTATDIIPINPSVNLGTLNQVPIPGTIWLLGAGLAGLVGIRRNRRK